MKIACIVATYSKESQPYLDLCLRSLKAQKDVDMQTIVISSGDYKPLVEVGPKGIHVHLNWRAHYPSAVMEGAKYISKDAEFVCLLNDDIVMNQNCLKAMQDIVNEMPTAIVNPMSNCDNHRFYFLSPNVAWPQQLRLEHLSPESIDSVIGASSDTNHPFFFSQWVALYCTMMTVKCFHDVGGLDTKYQTGQDDTDFCLRARQKGYQPGIASGAFCLHFSGVTADNHLTVENRKFSINYFNEKWDGIASMPNPF